MTKRHVNLGVTTDGAEDYLEIFQAFSELAYGLGATHEHVTVNAVEITELDQEIPPGDPEGLWFDEMTVMKVYRAIKDVLPHDKLDAHETANDVINNIFNAGILLRERPPKR